MPTKTLLLFCCLLFSASILAQGEVKLKHRDRKKDVELLTTEGNIIIRLADSTPMHRDNFLRLVKYGYFDSLLFHRVIRNFMIQSGDPNSKRALAHQPLGEGGPSYTIPSEFRQSLFHKKGAVAAARLGDKENPAKSSSGSQFYIVQGRTFTDRELDSVEVVRLNGRKLPADRRELYKTSGGTPQLDGNYTVFGEVVKGLDVVDRIASTPTSKGADRDRPLADMRILSAHLVKRDKKLKFSF
jgi:cyclophilin family peptidyl-prolyl cis-trans isomerase